MNFLDLPGFALALVALRQHTSAYASYTSSLRPQTLVA